MVTCFQMLQGRMCTINAILYRHWKYLLACLQCTCTWSYSQTYTYILCSLIPRLTPIGVTCIFMCMYVYFTEKRLSLIPRPPPFFVLRHAFSVTVSASMYSAERKPNNKFVGGLENDATEMKVYWPRYRKGYSCTVRDAIVHLYVCYIFCPTTFCVPPTSQACISSSSLRTAY